MHNDAVGIFQAKRISNGNTEYKTIAKLKTSLFQQKEQTIFFTYCK
jgi:hypothetical protein